MSARVSAGQSCILLFFAIVGPAMAADWRVTSPDGRLAALVSQCDNALCYSVELDGKEVLPAAPLGVTMVESDCNFVTGLAFVSRQDSRINETYAMVSGKKSLCRNAACEMTLIFSNDKGSTIHVVFRSYDDGIAFRYHFPGEGTRRIASEASGFHLPPESVGWLSEHTIQYESYYPRITAAEKPKKPTNFPALFRTPAGIWVLVTEAAVYGDYGGSQLVGSLAEPSVLRIAAPRRLSSTLPWTTPWRAAIIGSNLGTIVESVLVTNLNPPCELDDTSWIKPGRSTFPWWSDPNVNGKPDRLRQFVDFAADMGWEWLEFDNALIDSSFEANQKWMTTGWVADFVKYASQKGVNVYGWDDWRNLNTPEKRAKIFGLFNELGIKGIKIDFMNSDTQETFKWYDDTIRDCAKHRLMVSFHGATIPRGQNRRWPHIMTWEAVLGAEYYQDWSKTPPTPQHNCTLPFTRNVVGPMDYTPVTFSTARRKTTKAHELALSVIFESGWHNIADSPETYASSPAKAFLRDVPVAWDDVHFIDGYPGEFVCLARRKGNDWFIAAISAGEARTIKFPLGFLKDGSYQVQLFCDDAGGDIAVKEALLDTREPFVMTLPANGGFCTRIRNAARR